MWVSSPDFPGYRIVKTKFLSFVDHSLGYSVIAAQHKLRKSDIKGAVLNNGRNLIKQNL